MSDKSTKTTETVNKAVSTAVERTSETVAETSRAVTGVFNALTQSGRKTVEGVIEFDKALFGFARGMLNNYVEMGKASLKAKSINDLIDLQAAYAHTQIEATAVNARELIDLTRAKTKEAYAPIQEVVNTYRPGKAA